MIGKPDAEFDITEQLVRDLLAAQHPDLSSLPLVPLDSGWDNATFRLGADLTVRLPRRAMAGQLIQHEQRWLPALAPVLPIPISAPLRIGVPGADYPWHWSVLPWFEGRGADQSPPFSTQVDLFADFLRALHRPAPADAPFNPVRGVPLIERLEPTRERIMRLQQKTGVITPALLQIWGRGLAAPAATDPRWLHGDLHAQNVVVAHGRITAIIDWGDLTRGDVATDLPAIWGLFERQADRERLLELYAPDQHTLDRARAWAFMFGVILVDAGLVNSPRHAAQGADLLMRLGQDL